MAVTNQTYTNAGGNQLTAEAAEYYQRVLLETMNPKLMLLDYAEKTYSIPKNSGDTTSWRRFKLLATPDWQNNANKMVTSGFLLTEGVTPSSINAAVDKFSVTVKQYGTFIQTTDYLDLVGLDPVITQFTEKLGEHGGLLIDTVCRDTLAGGTNVVYAGSRTSRITVTSSDKITALDVLKIRRAMKRAFVPTIKLPNGKSGYIAFAHTDVIMDLMQTQEWKDQNTYIDNSARVEGVAGQMYGIYFVEYDNALKYIGAGASSCDVYGTLVLGAKAFGVTDINGSVKPQVIVKGVGSAGSSDPLDQRATIGYKNLFASVILNQEAVIRYECAASV